MKKYLFVFALFVAFFGLTSCSNDDDPITNDNALQFFSTTGCKSDDTRAQNDGGSLTDLFGQESVTYEGTEDGYLVVCHHNARFTCETQLSASVTIEDGQISISENYVPNTNCVCAYDLTMKIGPLNQGQYTVSVTTRFRDYPDTQKAPDFSFPINYNTSTKGEYIVNGY